MKCCWILLIMLAITGWLSCGEGSVRQDEKPKDSQMVAEHVDPSVVTN